MNETKGTFDDLKQTLKQVIEATFNDHESLLETDFVSLKRELAEGVESVVGKLLEKKTIIRTQQRERAVEDFHQALCREIKGYSVIKCSVCLEPEGMVPVWYLMCGHSMCVECSSSKYHLCVW